MKRNNSLIFIINQYSEQAFRQLKVLIEKCSFSNAPGLKIDFVPKRHFAQSPLPKWSILFVAIFLYKKFSTKVYF